LGDRLRRRVGIPKVLLAPVDHLLDDRRQRLAALGEGVVDPDRPAVAHLPLDQPLLFEVLEDLPLGVRRTERSRTVCR